MLSSSQMLSMSLAHNLLAFLSSHQDPLKKKEPYLLWGEDSRAGFRNPQTKAGADREQDNL